MSTDHYLEHLEQTHRRWRDATGVRDPSQLGEALITFKPGGAGLTITPASASVVPVTREVLEELLAKINGMRQQLAAVRDIHRRPNDERWCWTCEGQEWPCETASALGITS